MAKIAFCSEGKNYPLNWYTSFTFSLDFSKQCGSKNFLPFFLAILMFETKKECLKSINNLNKKMLIHVVWLKKVRQWKGKEIGLQYN